MCGYIKILDIISIEIEHGNYETHKNGYKLEFRNCRLSDVI